MRNQILILGGAGFIGSNLANALVGRGERPLIFTRPSYTLANIEDIRSRVDVVYGDLMDDVALKSAVEGADTVYHLVSTTFPSMTVESSVYDVLSNLLPTVRLLEICVTAGVKKVVYASSGGTIYGESTTIPIPESHPLVPISAYGQSKLTIENYLSFYARTTDLDIDVLRISNPYGPRQNPFGVQGIVAVAMGCMRSGRTLNLYDRGETVRDYIFISDVVEVMLLAANKPGSHITNVSTGKGHSVIEIVEAVEKMTGTTIEKQFIPARKGDVGINILSNRLAMDVFGWQPRIGLEEGLMQTWEWFRRSIPGYSSQS